MTTSYSDDADDGLTRARKGLVESYVDGITHARTWVMWGPLTFSLFCLRACMTLEPRCVALSVAE